MPQPISDEETITRAIRTAFPKPGPFHDDLIAANTLFPLPKGVLPGEVFEVYAYLSTGQSLLDQAERIMAYCFNPPLNYDLWYPRQGADQITFNLDGNIVDMGPIGSSRAAEGWLLYSYENLHSAIVWTARWRRRFDLE